MKTASLKEKITNLSYTGASAALNYLLTPVGGIYLFSCWTVRAEIRDAGDLWSGCQ